MRDLGGVGHAAAEECHFAAVLMREVQDLLEPVNGGAEAGDHQAARRAHEQVLQSRPHRAFAFGVAGTIDVGRIRQQQQHAALAVLGQRVQVEQQVVGGRRIDFEIAGMDDHAERRSDGQRHAAHERMGDVDELDRERPQLQPVAGLDGVELDVIDHAMLFQTPLHQRQREGGAVHRHGDLLQQKRHAADMVFVAVGQDQAADVGRVLFQIAEIGRDDIDAQELVIREHHPGVHYDDVVAVADGHGVHPELAQAAQRDDL